MTVRRRDCLLALAAGPWLHDAHAQTAPELGGWLRSVSLVGRKDFSVFGFAVYHAALWVEPGFDVRNYSAHGFALVLHYHRDFTNAAITRRALDEMARLAPMADARRQAWQAGLRSAFPDVRKGDRITGIHHPAAGAVFMTNGLETGRVENREFARLFFGIWLSSETSEPALRQALLGGTA